MLEPEYLRQFTAATRWLAQFPKTKAVNKYGSSYGLKHTAAPTITGTVGGYTCNGVFIAAAIAAGFRIEPTSWGSPNVRFNISTLAWSEPWRGRTAEAGPTAGPGESREAVHARTRQLEPAE
jgi:hypothetical protein